MLNKTQDLILVEEALHWLLELRMISMIFYSWSRSAALPTYNDILSLCSILMIHSHFLSRDHPDNEENDPGGGFKQ